MHIPKPGEGLKHRDEGGPCPEAHTRLDAGPCPDPDADPGAALYDRYGPAIFAYVYLYTSSREDAEDLTLEVFIAAMERANLSLLNDKERLAWLRRVAHNKLVDSYRQAARHPPAIALELVEETLYGDDRQEPEQSALRNEALRQLRATIASLSTEQQQVLHLRFGSGLSFAEIAVLLDKREAAVRKLLSRTIAFLRSIYDTQQEGGQSYANPR